jgi:outer membrane protein OmpA-like peptidoglycan-associated protein
MRAAILVGLAALAPPALADKIPYIEGLKVVTAVSQDGDYESVKLLEGFDGDAARLRVSTDRPVKNPCPTCARSLRFVSHRTVLRADLDSARGYAPMFRGNADEKFPGYTAIGASCAVLRELETEGEARFAWTEFVPTSERALRRAELKKAIGRSDEGTLRRVEKTSMSVLVNGERVDLPALRARGTFHGRDAELVFLDDPDNPLTLAFDLDIGARTLVLGLGGELKLTVVRIDYPLPKPRLADALASQGRVELSGIYFDFASETLKDESLPVLAEIAAALRAHPDWRLTIEGHTDNIGGDAYNLDLSRRRAAAVQAALVQRHGIAAERLTSDGFGASRPKETNDTLAGRARNRRVELVRRGP